MAPQQLRNSEPGEQDAGDTERKALQLDPAQRHAGAGGQCEAGDDTCDAGPRD